MYNRFPDSSATLFSCAWVRKKNSKLIAWKSPSGADIIVLTVSIGGRLGRTLERRPRAQA